MTTKGNYLDLASLSMSGSLMPSVPEQLLLKFNPPKISIIYHMEKHEDAKYYHDILIERRMLESQSDEDICSHLFVTEAYYFNPKQIKRQQVLKLIKLLKDGLNRKKNDQATAPQGQAKSGDSKAAQQEKEEQESKKQNFFQKKRFVNYEMQGDNSDEEFELDGNRQTPQENQQNQLFEEDPIIKSLPQNQQAITEDVRKPVSQKQEQNDVKSQGFDMMALNSKQQASVPSIYDNDLFNQKLTDLFENQPKQDQQQNQQKQQNSQHKQGEYDDLLDMVDFDSDHEARSPNNDQNLLSSENEPKSQLMNENDSNFKGSQQQIEGFDMGNQEQEGEEEEESVYIKDNIVMRRIQIEGEDSEYLMDPEGNIYDMQGNFIGTANANELEEMEDDQIAN